MCSLVNYAETCETIQCVCIDVNMYEAFLGVVVCWK